MFTLNCNGRLLLMENPAVMGIINLTPDSFYAESRQGHITNALHTAERMLSEGAAILDIGGQSSRPGSERISEEQELRRVIEPLGEITKRFPEAFISIDTFYAVVAREAVARGASIVNDISAGSIDPNLHSTVASLKVPYVLMHMQGNPQSMQVKPSYEDVTREVLDFFIRETAKLKSMGIHDIIPDPGFGFGKTMAHNFQLLRDLQVFEMLKAPLLIGVSRKSTISKTLGVPTEETLNGTTALNTIGLVNGAMILRVHDVKEAVQAVTLYNSVYCSNK
jgi:dihydropteroate synthase